MRWFIIFALLCSSIIAEVLIWSPNRLLNEERVQFTTADAACLIAGLYGRSPLGECVPNNSNELEFSGNSEFLSCIVFLSLTNKQNIQYLMGTYADSGVATIFDILQSAHTIIELSSGHLKNSIFTNDSRFSSVYIDKSNFETFELSFQPTLVEVKLDDMNPEDVHFVLNRIEKVFSKNYLGVLSHSSSATRSWTTLQDEGKKVSTLSPSDVLTWEILVALVVGLLLISILAFFLDLLSKIDTPLRFQRRPFDVSKEY